MSPPKIILIAGPTAAGKSALALDLARQHNGTIINADAMQVYAGLPILTSQPGPEALAQAPHELYGTLDPATPCSAGKWLELATAVIGKALDGGRTPVVVGGTGLYFRALTDGLAAIPEIPASVRDEAEALYDRVGEAAFRRLLAQRDPTAAARLAKNDRQRLVRAYEVALHTGKPLSEWQKGDSGFGIRHSGIRLGRDAESRILNPECHLLLPPRAELYAACDRRFAAMIEAGAVAEAETFQRRKLSPALPAMKTIGLREIISYLNGACTLAEATAKARQATRNYAKRQMTWFRNQWRL